MTDHHAASTSVPSEPSATAPPPRHVLIVGGGFSGGALAVHLLRRRSAALRVTLVAPGPLGRGVAYDTDPSLLLNVPAARMSLDPADPDDLRRWADAAPTELLSRARYGDYVAARLEAARNATTPLTVLRTTATGLARAGGGWRVGLAEGGPVVADEVVLATGLGPPAVPRDWAPLARHPRVVSTPLAPNALEGVAPDEAVLVLGTGLTALDAVLLLLRRGHRGAIHAASRRGWWPRPHLPDVIWTGAPSRLDPATAPATADGLAAWLAAHVAAEVERGLPWQAGFDAVRPHVPALWARLPDAERARFLSVWRPAWEVLRHRAPAPLLAELAAREAAGQLRTWSGGATPVDADAGGITARVGGEALRVGRLLVCVGAEPDPRRWGSALWDGLLADGLVQVDPHGLGVRTDDRGATLDAEGRATGLWALGALQRPRWFESTAVPELAAQVARVAAALAGGAP